MKAFKAILGAIVILFASIAYAGGASIGCDDKKPKHKTKTVATANAKSVTDVKAQGGNVTVSDGSGKIRIAGKPFDSEISPREPANYEGSWSNNWCANFMPWNEREQWTDEDVADFPDSAVEVSRGIYKKKIKRSYNVTFGYPIADDGIVKAGIIRFRCADAKCTPEALHKVVVMTAHKIGIAYLREIDSGVMQMKEGGDWSARIGGGGSSIIGDGAIGGGGGIGGGRYWTGPAFLSWAVFEAWVHVIEGEEIAPK